MNLKCWWFGCIDDEESRAYTQPDYATCVRCGGNLSYEHLVGITRHNAVMEKLHTINPLRLIPTRCKECGKWYGHNDDCEWLIPF